MNTNMQLTIDRINSLSVRDVVADDAVKANFIRVYDTLWGDGLGEKAYERESVFFMRAIDKAPDLQKCTPFSAFSAFIDIAICGLSLEQGTQALAYVQPRNIKIGAAQNPDGTKKSIYEPRAVLLITGYGEMAMRTRSGQIRHADNPVLVYEGDEFSFSEHNGQKSVDYTCRLPHTGQRIVACFLRITRADGSVDYAIMFEEDWERLRSYSMKNNGKYNTATRRYEEGEANVLYSSNDGQIDTGFLKAKCIKHAFQSYPKVRVGKATELETQAVDDVDSLYDMEEVAHDKKSASPCDDSFASPQADSGKHVESDDEVF